jgi:hypothetical protein
MILFLLYPKAVVLIETGLIFPAADTGIQRA